MCFYIRMWLMLCYMIVHMTNAAKTKFNNYKVFKIIPFTNKHVRILESLKEYHDLFSFWEEPLEPKIPVQLIIPPGNVTKFISTINKTNIFF